MSTNDTHHDVKYLNTSRDNFKKWKRSVDAKLANLPIDSGAHCGVRVDLELHELGGGLFGHLAGGDGLADASVGDILADAVGNPAVRPDVPEHPLLS